MHRDHLAEEFFLIGHNEFTGKLLISPDLLQCGLVAAQLADLVIAGRLSVAGGKVEVAAMRGSGQDEIAAFVVESVQRQTTGYPVRAWTETLSDVLFELVARRLVERGIVRREPGRGLVRRRPDRFPAVDLLKAAGPRIRLEHMFRQPVEFDLPGAFCGALVSTLGVYGVLDPDLDKAMVRDLSAKLSERLPADLIALLDGVRDAVSAISLTIRR